jgi:tetratricopeptide (TPR) repeat protein
VASNPRIDELRKRLEAEPGSRLFGQLAEELRKAGELDEAVGVALEGLQKHPNYASARMTLGRCLFDKGDLAGARSAFETVLKGAPDNILAGRFLAESLEGLGELRAAVEQYKAVVRLSPGDAQLAERLAAAEARAKAPQVAAPEPAAIEAPPASHGPAEGAEPAPIPLASVDGEDFELERPYESGSTRTTRDAGPAPEGEVPAPALEAPSAERPHLPEAVPPAPFVIGPPRDEAAPGPGSAVPLAGLRRLEGEPPPPWVEPAPAAEIVSSTLAELYFSQGVTEKAIEVYRQVLAREPGNDRARGRLAELERLDRHLQEEESSGAAPEGDPRERRRAAIQRAIERLEVMLAAVRKE